MRASRSPRRFGDALARGVELRARGRQSPVRRGSGGPFFPVPNDLPETEDHGRGAKQAKERDRGDRTFHRLDPLAVLSCICACAIAMSAARCSRSDLERRHLGGSEDALGVCHQGVPN